MSSVDRLRAGAFPGITPEAILIPVVSALVCLTLALYKLRVGRREGILPLVSDAYHTLTDFLTSTSAGLGLAVVHAGYPAADPAIAMAISFLLFYLSFLIGRSSVSLLMERAAPEQVISEMKLICRQTPGVRGFHRLRTRCSGSKIFADVHVVVDQKSVREAHEIASKLERRLKSRIHGLSSVVIHVEPERKSKSSTSRKERS
jgi:ferrous-iron efflux pump FieF